MTWMLLPGLVWIVLFWAIPIPHIIVGLKDFKAIKGTWDSEWSGFYNLEFFFTGEFAGRTLRNTLFYSFFELTTSWFYNSVIAVWFYWMRSNRAMKIYNTIMMLPKFMNIMMIKMIVQALLAPGYGIFYQLTEAWTGEGFLFYDTPQIWPLIMIVGKDWQTIGTGCIWYYAAMTSMDPGLMEAAEIDGANKLQQTMHILYPHILPTVAIMLIMGLGGVLGGDTNWHYIIASNVLGGSKYLEILPTYMLKALLGGDFTRSGGVQLFSSLVSLSLVIGVNLIVRKIAPESAMF